jgi:adhesin transport system outer membrane protein
MTKKSSLQLFSASIFTTSLLASQPILAQSISEAVAQTVQSNPTILAESNSRLSADQRITQAKAGYYPTVDFGIGTGWETTDNPATRAAGKGHHESMNRDEANISIRQMLYDGFATKNAVDQSESLSESAGYSVADTAETTGLRAVEVYLDVLRREELLAATEQNLESHERIYGQISQRAKSGVGTQADAVQTQGRLALAKSNLESNIGNLQDAKSSFLRVVGNEPESLTDPSQECCDKAPATIEDALKIAQHQHPALRSAIAEHEASLAQAKGAEAPFHPRVDLEIDASANAFIDGQKGHNKDLLAMARMRYNLLNGGADKARIGQTEFLSEQAKAEAEIAKRQIENDVRLAWSALDSSTSRLQYLEQHVKASEQTRDAYQEQFNVGLRSLLDLLDTENEVLTARINYINAYYNRIYSCYWLSESTGKLLEHLELEAPAEAVTVASPQ